MKSKAIKIIHELCRHHISLLLVITLIDLVLIAAGQRTTICLGLLSPQWLLTVGSGLASALELPAMLVSGWVTALVIVAMLAVCLAASYSHRGWLLCAAVMVALDAAIAVLNIIGGDYTYYFDIAAHAWMVVALVGGYFTAPAAG